MPILNELISPTNLWRGELHGGFLFSFLHAWASMGAKRYDLLARNAFSFCRSFVFVFWTLFLAYVFEHFGLSYYSWLGCPFGKYVLLLDITSWHFWYLLSVEDVTFPRLIVRYRFSEAFLAGAEGIKVGIVPIGVWSSWYAVYDCSMFRLSHV
jgi:hypothetical protein